MSEIYPEQQPAAASPGPAPVTPGQAAYEAWRGADQAFAGQLSWGSLRGSDRERWEGIARAATDNSTAWRIAARELERERDEARAVAAEILGRFHDVHRGLVECDATPEEYAKWRQRAGLEDS